MKKNTLIRAVPSDPARETPPPAPLARTFRLGNARAIRRELAVLYGEMRNGQTDIETAKAGAFLLRTILEALRTDDLEVRIDELEGTAR